MGLETAINLQTMGAHIVLFSEKRGALAHSLQTWGEWPCDGSWEEITSSAGRALATQGLDIDLSNIPTLREYFDKYYSTLANQQNIQKMIKSFWVDRVHKRILMPEEFIAGKSRIIDLFRVVYHDGELERFEDFDLVNRCHRPHSIISPARCFGKSPHSARRPRPNRDWFTKGWSYLKIGKALVNARAWQ